MSEVVVAPPSASVASRPLIRFLDGVNVLVVLALAVFVASFAVQNSDFWLHLASGRLIVGGSYPFGVDPFSAVEPAPAWINHAWLYDLLLYQLYQAGDGAAVVIAKAVIVALTAAVLLLIRIPRSSVWLAVFCTALALLAASPRLLMQPTVVSLFLLSVLLYLLFRSRPSESRWRLPVAVAVLFLAWVNLDGAFLLGLAVVGLWFIGGLIQQFAPMGLDLAGKDFVPPMRRGVVLLCAVLASLVNPYGFHAFTLPSDWAYLTLPANLHNQDIFRNLFRSPLDKDYSAAVAGVIPAGAYFLLIGLGVGSLILNLSAWRWDRALVWLVVAVPSLFLARLVPYFAVIGAALTVLNIQEFSFRRGDRTVDSRTAFARSFMGGFGRFITVLAGLGLLALAWPGGLGADAGAMRPRHRVAWRVEPDESSVRAAQQLDSWHKSGQLQPADRGFHVPYEFGYYCAWYCPAEKILFDYRMTNPSAAAPYVETRAALLTRDRAEAAKPPPGPQMGANHLAVIGPSASIASQRLLYRSQQFPLWAIAGQSLLMGWQAEAGPKADSSLRLDPLRLAASGAKVPPPAVYSDPPNPSPLDRYWKGAKPPPADVYEAGLWLVVREAAMARLGPIASASQIAAALGRSSPNGPSDIANRLCEPLVVGQLVQGLMEGVLQQSTDGHLARLAPLLALHAARRAILDNPDDYDSYTRLVGAYDALDADQALVPWRQVSYNQLQQITAARQAIERLPLAKEYGQFTAADERALQSILVHHYEQMTVLEGISSQPLDLMLDAYTRIVACEAEVYKRQRDLIAPNQLEQYDKSYEQSRKNKLEQLAKLEQDVKRRRNDYENRAGNKATLSQRAALAAAFGLPLESLNVLRGAAPATLSIEDVRLMLDLLVLAGQADDAHAILQGPNFNPLTVLKPELQPTFRTISLKTQAALGDAAAAIELMNPIVQNDAQAVGPPLAGTLLWLVFPDLGLSPLTRGMTTPMWFGMFPKNQPATMGNLLQTQATIQHRCDDLVQQALFALEYGDFPLAKRRFEQALQVAGSMPFPLRGTAIRWRELLNR